MNQEPKNQDELDWEIIDQFIKDTPSWHKGFGERHQQQECIFCGTCPDKILALSKEVEKLKDLIKSL